MRIKLAAVLAFVLFVVLAGGGAAQAYWLSQVSASSSVEVASLASNCTPATRLTNGSFETPVIPNASYLQGPVSSWSTTDSRGIELWSSGFNGVQAQVGRQFVELNAESAGTLWQDIATTSGQTIRWSLVHRAREGVDTMRVSLGPVGASGGVSQGTYSATTAAWVRHEGTYTVPTGQTTTRFSMTAVSTGSGNPTIGNFIDDVSFGSGPCLKPTSSVTNASRALSATRVGDVLNYVTTVTNTGGSQALTSTLSAVLPVGIVYQPNSLRINGTLQSDTAVNDQGEYTAPTRTLSTRLGLNASATTGGSIAPDQIITVTFNAVATAVGVGSSVDYVATAEYTDYLASGWPQSAASTPVGFTIVAADVEVTPLSTPGITPGSPATWTFSVTNNGPSVATGVNVAVTIPVGTSSPSVTRTTSNGSATNCTGTGSPRTCSLGTLNSGDTRTITVNATAPTRNPAASYTSTAAATSTSYDHISTNDTVDNVGLVVDGSAPSTPAGLAAANTTETRTTISWDDSTDNIGVAGYDVYRDGALQETTSSTSYTNQGLESGTQYSYTVVAFDAAGNRSPSSAVLRVTTIFDSTQWYSIEYPHGSLCVGTSNTNNNTPLQIVTCESSDVKQQWRFEHRGSGYYNVVARYDTSPWNNDSLWDISGTNARVNESSGNSNDQRWMPIATQLSGAMFVGFQHQNSSNCLDVPNSGQSAGTQLQRYTCNSSAAQSFLLTKVP